MPIDPDRLLNWTLPEVETSFSTRETILYALGVGLGNDPADKDQLRFVYEGQLKALPTMAVVLCHPGDWLGDVGVDTTRLVHGEQGLVLYRPLPPQGDVVGKTRVTGFVDKGPGRGALIYLERELSCKNTGLPLATVTTVAFARGDGGCSGSTGPAPEPHRIPDREPDICCDLATFHQMALVYRLSGDLNPLHADPDFARKAGFERPVLHGLATFGVAGHAILKELCDYNPDRLAAISGRFTSPVFPGETFRTEIWVDGDIVSFRTSSVERGVMAINNGHARLRSADVGE
ncbi:enoyl-CoA hydratase protein (plasmid) [Rhizobium gallicum]|uniref:Enoyl-CoA hydratase protein n=1 Tax=Rhizobium gallicum TaxID=56730 RepID=A0A1L5NS27_9HYPH|nr:MaoC/PaaZ C-terminal domain-containing protein [Rhizobium gallicum]APO70700.1 enoyl-CoA hydratase protein [Rhizobium gallicum]